MRNRFLEMLSAVWGSSSAGGIFTPLKTCGEMVCLLNSTGFFDKPVYIDQEYVDTHRVIDIYCKSGNFLLAFYYRFSLALCSIIPDKAERDDFIFKYLLHSVCENMSVNLLIQKRIKHETGYEGYDNFLSYDFVRDYAKVKETLSGMRFDVVVGNPPYNKDRYIDFVLKGFELSSNYTLMITPAKWQTCADNYKCSSSFNYKVFRDCLHKYISYVCFYPDALDLFNISQVDGITYFLIGKTIVDKCIVENKSIHNITYNSLSTRSICSRESLYNRGNDIIESLGNYTSFRPSTIDITKRFKVIINSQFVISGCGSEQRKKCKTGEKSGIFNSSGKIVVLSRPEIRGSVPSGAYSCVYSADDIEECENFISWLNTKLVRFLILCNVNKLTGIYDDNYWRFVPLQTDFSHPYTDAGLYKMYNLSADYIDIIDSVIQER